MRRNGEEVQSCWSTSGPARERSEEMDASGLMARSLEPGPLEHPDEPRGPDAQKGGDGVGRGTAKRVW